MKKIRKLLLLVLCAAFVAVSALFAVACNDDKSDSGDNGGTSGNEQTETTYTVTYALGDHAAADATAPAAATANKANSYKVTLPAAPAAATGWKFNGWKVGNDVKAAGAEITVSANVTVTAQWAEDVAPAVTYTVTYALGDHAAADATAPAAATATEANGYKVTLPDAPKAAEGWKFNGWKVGNDVKAAGAEITVSANMTVTADWAEVTYTVTYSLGDHAAADATVPPAGTANLANSYKVTLPAAPKAADGWKFNGWRVEGDVHEAGEEITVSADLTVTATWSADTTVAEIPEVYRGSWISAGADVAPETIDITAQGATYHDQSVTLTAAADGSSYTFSATVDDVATTFTVKLLADFENRVLLLSSSSGSVYMVKEDATYPALNFSADLVGNWAPALATDGDPIEFQANALLVKGLTATVLVYDSNDTTTIIKYIVQGEIYTLTYTAETKTLTSLHYGVDDAVEVSYTKEAAAESVKLPENFQGTWKNDDHTVVVDEEGNFSYDGETFSVYGGDMNEYTFSDKDGKEWTFYLQDETNMYFRHGYEGDEFTLAKEVIVVRGDLPEEFDGVWTNSDNTITITDGNLAINGDPYDVTAKADNHYGFTMYGLEYEIYLDNGELVFACLEQGMESSQRLTRQGDAPSAWNWGVTVDATYAGVYSDGTHTLVIYKDGKVSFDGQRAKVSTSVASNGLDYAAVDLENGDHWQFSGLIENWNEASKRVRLINNDGQTVSLPYTEEAPDTYTEGGSTGPVGPEDPDVPGDGVFTADQQGTYKDPMAAEGGFAYTFVVSANKVEVSDAEGNTETFEGDNLVKGDGVYNLMKDGSALYTLTFGDDGSLSVYWATDFMDYRLEKEVSAPEEGIFNADQQGTYKDLADGGYDDVVVVSANKVEITGSSAGNLTFEGAEITKQDDGSFLLQKDGAKILLTFGDGSVSVDDQTNWTNFTLQKEGSSEGPEEPEGFTVHYELGDHYDTNMVLPGDETLTDDTGYTVYLPELDAAYGYKFLGWQKNGAGDLLAAGTSVTITEDTTFNAVWDNYYDDHQNVTLGTWGQVLNDGGPYTLNKGDKLVLTGSLSGKEVDAGYGIVAQLYVNGVVGNNDNYYFYRPDCPVKVVSGTWNWWTTDYDWNQQGWVEETYKATPAGSVTITLELRADGIVVYTVVFTSDTYSYTNVYTAKEAIDSALVYFAQDHCTTEPVQIKHYKTPDLFTAEQQGTYKSADGKVTVTVTGTTVTVAVDGKEAKTVNAKDILVGADGQYGLFTYVSEGPGDHAGTEPEITLEFTDEGVSLLDDYAEYLPSKDVALTKQPA